jgi:predicted nucleic acid-binding protein
MAKKRTAEIFLDTGAFVAWLVAADRQHQAAADLFASISAPLTTSLAVVAETYSLFLHRFGEDAARTFRSAIKALPAVRLCAIDAEHHRAVERKLDRLRGIKLTYVDASSLVILGERRIETVWGTDSDLGAEGAKVIPGPP